MSFDLESFLQASLLAQQPDLNQALGSDEQRSRAVPGERSGAFLMTTVALGLEGFEELEVFAVEALLVLCSHLTYYKINMGGKVKKKMIIDLRIYV